MPQPQPRKTIVFAVGERQAAILERLFNKLLPDAACLRIAQQTNRSPAEVRQSFAQKLPATRITGTRNPSLTGSSLIPCPLSPSPWTCSTPATTTRRSKKILRYAPAHDFRHQVCPDARLGRPPLPAHWQDGAFLIYDFVNNTANSIIPATVSLGSRESGRRPGPGGPPEPEPGPTPRPEPPPGPPPTPREFKVIKEGSLEDEFCKRQMIVVGPAGLVIDRQRYQDQWVRRIEDLRQTDPAVRKILSGEDVTETRAGGLPRNLTAPSSGLKNPRSASSISNRLAQRFHPRRARELIKAERGADEIVERAGGLIKGFAERGFFKPELRGVEFLGQFLPLVLGHILAGEDLAHDRIGLAQPLDAPKPLVRYAASQSRVLPDRQQSSGACGTRLPASLP